MPKNVGLEHRPQYAVGFGAPDAVILEEAKKHNAELIVLGARGDGSLAGRFGSGTAYKVVVGAECPVLTIHMD